MIMTDKTEMPVERWRAIRREAGLHIDPETAEVMWTWGQIADPYGIEGADLPGEHDCVGRIYFAQSPGSGVWVEFGDLPKATVAALWKNEEAWRRFEEN
jgi:hypothetical protein